MKTDYEFIADQLINAWEFMGEAEMLEYLSQEIGVNDTRLQKIVNEWYNDVNLRMRMELIPQDEFEIWLKSIID